MRDCVFYFSNRIGGVLRYNSSRFIDFLCLFITCAFLSFHAVVEIIDVEECNCERETDIWLGKLHNGPQNLNSKAWFRDIMLMHFFAKLQHNRLFVDWFLTFK